MRLNNVCLLILLLGVVYPAHASKKAFRKFGVFDAPGCLIAAAQREAELTEQAALHPSPRAAPAQLKSPEQPKIPEKRRRLLGMWADIPPTARSRPPSAVGGGAVLPHEKVVVGPFEIDVPEVRYHPSFSRRRDELAATRQLPGSGPLRAQAPVEEPAIVGWHTKPDGTLGFHMDVIEEKVAFVWKRVRADVSMAKPRPLGQPLGSGAYKWVYQDPYDSNWVIKVMKPGGAEGRKIESTGLDVFDRTVVKLKHEIESDLLMQKMIERHRQEMLASGKGDTRIEVLQREYPPEALRFGSFREKKIPPNAVDIRSYLVERSHLKEHRDFKNISEFVKKYSPLMLQHRVDRGLTDVVTFARFDTREEALNSLHCRFFGFEPPIAPTEVEVIEVINGIEKKVKKLEWQVEMGMDVQGLSNLSVIPEPGNRYRFIWVDR